MGIEKTLKASMLTSVAVIWGISASAQGVFIGTNGLDVQVSGKTYEEVSGSPYLNKTWTNGLLKLADGTIYTSMLNYDQVNGHVLFLKDGNTYLLQTPLKEFVLDGPDGSKKIFLNGFPANGGGGNEKTFYELLVNGDAKLLKLVKKNIVEERGNGSILPSKQIQTTTDYYLFVDGKLNLIKNKNSVIDALSSKNNLASYISAEKLKFKGEDDLINITKFYNKP